MTRTLIWFSAGAASAVATKLALAQHDNCHIARIDTGSEHPDNERFAKDCETWFGQTVHLYRSERYTDTWDVWNKTRYLVGPTGARCTIELKKKVRFAIEQADDIQVFGYTHEEQHRAERFRQQNPDINLSTPLIDAGLTKSDCLAMIARAEIELPAMYKLGYLNNNCIGCPKGGMGYWNKIRKDFPDVFDRMALVERDIGANILKDENGPIYLDELDPNRGNHADEPNFECSLMCHLAESQLA